LVELMQYVETSQIITPLANRKGETWKGRGVRLANHIQILERTDRPKIPIERVIAIYGGKYEYGIPADKSSVVRTTTLTDGCSR